MILSKIGKKNQLFNITQAGYCQTISNRINFELSNQTSFVERFKMQSINQIQTSRSLPTLRLGSQGEDVKYLQNLLNYIYGPELNIDGIFGTKTETAVKKFQKDYGLAVDGIVGRNTWNKLEQIRSAPVEPLATVRLGSTGSDVKYLQDILNSLGYSVVADNIFGAKTEAAVKQFQKDYGLAADGIVGPTTWSTLLYQIHG